MTIIDKVEDYGFYFMELATDEEVAEYWELVDGADYHAEFLKQSQEFLCCGN
jgi:hypothetical protein